MRQIGIVLLCLLALAHPALADESYRVVSQPNAESQLLAGAPGAERLLLLHPNGRVAQIILDEVCPPPTGTWPWLAFRGHSDWTSEPGAVVGVLNVRTYELRAVRALGSVDELARLRWVRAGSSYQLWADERRNGLGRAVELTFPSQPFARSGQRWFDRYIDQHHGLVRALTLLAQLRAIQDPVKQAEAVRRACRPTACSVTVDHYLSLVRSAQPFVPAQVCTTGDAKGHWSLCITGGPLDQNGHLTRVTAHLDFSASHGWFEIVEHQEEWLRHAEQGCRDDDNMEAYYQQYYLQLLRKKGANKSGGP